MIAAPIYNEHPPKPRLVLRVGIVGHRTQPLRAMGVDLGELRVLIDGLLDSIQTSVTILGEQYSHLFSDDSVELHLITALAAGSDSIAAECAAHRNYTVKVIFPFLEASYERDFTEKIAKRQKEVDEASDHDVRLAKEGELADALRDHDLFRNLSERFEDQKVVLDNPCDKSPDNSALFAREVAYTEVGQLLVNHSDLRSRFGTA